MSPTNQPPNSPPPATPTGTPPPTPAEVSAEIEATEQTAEDIDELSEQLAVHSIISEERHDEILTEVGECKNQLEQLSTRLTTETPAAESPQLSLIQAELIQVNGRLATLETTLKSFMDLNQRTPTQSVSPQPNEENPVAQEVPAVEVPPVSAPVKRRRPIL